LLYLFSSNSQPQYAQDILNTIAGPKGYRMTFRYDAKFVDARARTHWDSRLDGHPVLIHFVLQQAHQYFEPVLFPVCRGQVISVRREGDIHLIHFTVGDVVSLPHPEDLNAYWKRTDAYRQLLQNHDLPLPYVKYAIFSDYDVVEDGPGALMRSDRPSPNDHSVPEVFRLTTEFLAKTDTFATARFSYVSRLCRRGGKDPESIDATSHGYKLTAGEEYELEFLQAQPGLIRETSTMKVILDGNTLQAIGPSELSIGSPYDVQSIRIAALPTTGPKYTTIGLRPAEGVQGPILDIPVETRPSTVKKFGRAIGTAIALVAVGLSSIFTGLGGGAKLALVLGGAVLASVLGAFRLTSTSL